MITSMRWSSDTTGRLLPRRRGSANARQAMSSWKIGPRRGRRPAPAPPRRRRPPSCRTRRRRRVRGLRRAARAPCRRCRPRASRRRRRRPRCGARRPTPAVRLPCRGDARGPGAPRHRPPAHPDDRTAWVGSGTCSRWTPTRGRSASTRTGCGGSTTPSGRYVDDGRLPGWTIAVTPARQGGAPRPPRPGRPRERPPGRADDTLWRIYSMTKPITSVAAMMLYEEGALRAHRPGRASSSRSSPTPRVYVGGSAAAPGTVPAVEPIRVWHLLTHTAGLTYGFHHAHAVDEMYRARGLRVRRARRPWTSRRRARRGRGSRCCSSPGAEWNYSRGHRRARPASSRSSSGQPLDGSSPSASSARSA